MSGPFVLVIAGHDPTGGAGIQADIEAVASMGCRAATVVTALTVQDTRNVTTFVPTPASLLMAQAEAVLNDLPIAAIKIGMIGSEENVRAIAALLHAWPQLPVVLDPVLAAGGGGSLSKGALAARITEELLPRVTLVTPNSLEARLLCPSAGNLDECGMRLSRIGRVSALLTGGHENGAQVSNRLWQQGRCVDEQHWQRLPGEYHGSGCTLASACAGLLAHGRPVVDACAEAQSYTWKTLQLASTPGAGQALPERFFWLREKRRGWKA